MSHSVRAVSTALTALLILATGAQPVAAAVPTACGLVNASRASTLFAKPVTTMSRISPISAGSTICVYSSGGTALMQLAVTVMQSEGIAKANFKMSQEAGVANKDTGNRQKRNYVLSAITMNDDRSKLDALLDAAVKNI
jgi:uncharacterized membrane protein